jgi:DNA polymerase-1
MARIFTEAAAKVRAARLSEDMDAMKRAEFEEDIHRNTAAAAFGVTLDQVTKPMRHAAKAITFGILFQQGLPALASAIKESEEKAKELASLAPQPGAAEL